MPERGPLWTAVEERNTAEKSKRGCRRPRARKRAGLPRRIEFGGDMTALPAGDVWLDIINQTPAQDRHFAVHEALDRTL
jgi:hypothetical protein